jgi:hypothetical protein
VPRHQNFHESGPAKAISIGFLPFSQVSLMEIIGDISEASCRHQNTVIKFLHA